MSWLGGTWVFLAQFQSGCFPGGGGGGDGGHLQPRPQVLTSGTATVCHFKWRSVSAVSAQEGGGIGVRGKPGPDDMGPQF